VNKQQQPQQLQQDPLMRNRRALGDFAFASGSSIGQRQVNNIYAII